MPRAPFQVAVIFEPGRLLSLGVTRGDLDRGVRFLLAIRPAVDRFIAETRQGSATPTADNFVSPSEAPIEN
jgi:hypothetical protein